MSGGNNMSDMILYAVKIPFINDWMYLTEGSGNDIHHKFFDTLEEAQERADSWKGKVVTVTFEEEL